MDPNQEQTILRAIAVSSIYTSVFSSADRQNSFNVIEEFKKYAGDGVKILREHQANKDQFYLDWSFYGTCQACEADKDLGEGL